MHSKIQFLCPTHREWVATNPERARDYIDEIIMKGSALLKKNACQDAMPYLGCAMESIEILDNESSFPDSWLLSLLPSVANSLALCLVEAGENMAADTVAFQAWRRLEEAKSAFQSSDGIPSWLHHSSNELVDVTKVERMSRADVWHYTSSAPLRSH